MVPALVDCDRGHFGADDVLATATPPLADGADRPRRFSLVAGLFSPRPQAICRRGAIGTRALAPGSRASKEKCDCWPRVAGRTYGLIRDPASAGLRQQHERRRGETEGDLEREAVAAGEVLQRIVRWALLMARGGF